MEKLINHKAFIRYKTIDALLRKNTLNLIDPKSQIIDIGSNRSIEILTLDKIIEACNEAYNEHAINGKVARSWVYEDLKFLKSKDGPRAPIKTRIINKRADYYYDSTNYSLFSTEWYKQNALSFIEKSLAILEPEKMEEGVLFKKMHDEILAQLSEVGNTDRIIYKDNNPLIKWHKWFDLIYQAISNRSKLEIEYEPFEKSAFSTEFHPHIIKEYNRRYFVFGVLNDGTLMNYALDRIQSIKQIAGNYINSRVHWDDYFSELVGVTKFNDQKLTTVRLRLPRLAAQYFKTKPIITGHIKTKESEDYVEFSFDVFPNRELENVLMTFIPDLILLEPDQLRKKIIARMNTGLVRLAVQ
jgi:hypothetical protein